eukprot:CAMPEP_0172067864 /NCGR_PEP_ID=MMETSP1043-20130122/11914_1 /TAXON_ID=464988 /ORGANISM="Hemiselmis andersenii, Strain CCMP441" /LENGTH=106 /DNA_ID=CAMNT_0012728103 /DNA_START=201 /DNA_END=517 /DNA_ORIENTATION=+
MGSTSQFETFGGEEEAEDTKFPTSTFPGVNLLPESDVAPHHDHHHVGIRDHHLSYQDKFEDDVEGGYHHDTNDAEDSLPVDFDHPALYQEGMPHEDYHGGEDEVDP